MKTNMENYIAPSNVDINDCPEHIGNYVRALEEEVDLLETYIRDTYGYLWRSMSSSPQVIKARKDLLSLMTKDDQKRGIQMAITTFGPVSDHEMLMRGP